MSLGHIYHFIVSKKTFYSRIIHRDNSFGMVVWESQYDFGRPKTCKDSKNITDKVILCTLWVCDYNSLFFRTNMFVALNSFTNSRR